VSKIVERSSVSSGRNDAISAWRPFNLHGEVGHLKRIRGKQQCEFRIGGGYGRSYSADWIRMGGWCACLDLEVHVDRCNMACALPDS
jgi:hypothetical protein